MRFTDTLERLRGGLIVSCQAYPGEAMRDPRTMAQIAAAAVVGGAAGIRVQGIDDIRATAHLPVPVVGLWKDGDAEVFITPTLGHAEAVADAGADIVAIDGTRRPRPDGLSLAETIAGLRAHTDALIMADCGSRRCDRRRGGGRRHPRHHAVGIHGRAPEEHGARPGAHRADRRPLPPPDRRRGRIHSPGQAATAIAAGAFSVCVGTAITHPSTITTWFADAVAGARG